MSQRTTPNSKTKKSPTQNSAIINRTGSRSDILSVVSTLDSFWLVLEREISEIDKDISNCKYLNKKYEENHWENTIQVLKRTKKDKEVWFTNFLFFCIFHLPWDCFLSLRRHVAIHQSQLRNIKLQMELFNLHLESGRELCRKLVSKQPLQQVTNESAAAAFLSPSSPSGHHSQLIQVVSPILANKSN